MTTRRSAFVLLLLAVLMLPLPSAAQQLRIATFQENDPVTVIARRVMLEAYRRLGIAVEIRYLPGERAIRTVNSGDMDAELFRVAGVDGAFPNLLRIPVPIYVAEMVVFTRDASLKVEGWKSLQPYSIGYVLGVKVIEANTTGMRVEPVNTMDQAFAKLAIGRTDVVIEDRLSGLFVLKANKLEGVHVLAPPLAKVPLYHYLNKKHASLLPRLVDVLRKMEKEGTIRAIAKRVAAEML
jgi:polar amino acid transport system substrate-binding protein